MQRRQVLAALGSLLAVGCLGAKRPETTSGVRTEGGYARGTPTPVPTATPEPTPDPTETPEPTESPESADSTESPEPAEADVEAGAAAIDRVQAELDAAVEAYTGDEDGSLSGVPVTGDRFDVRTVLVAVDAVQRELVAAEAAAATDDQRETVADLRVAERFLTLSALAHSYFVEAVDRLDAARAAVGEGVDAVETAEERFDRSLARGSDRLSTVKNEVDSDAVAVGDPFDDDTYDDTVSAFEAVRSVLRDASSGLDRMVQGLDELEEAREDEEDGDDDDAVDSADEARDLFDEAYEFFDDAAAAAAARDADDLEATLEALRGHADDQYLEADDLYEDVS
jgi:hypothetical protein